MKVFFILLLCFGILTAFSAPALTRGMSKHEPHMKEFLAHYKNGNLRSKTIVIYDKEGNEEKTITEAYRKDGTRRYRSVMNPSDLLQYTSYNKQGLMKFERSYYYSYSGYLERVETRRANGERQVWTQPPPEPQGCYYAHHY